MPDETRRLIRETLATRSPRRLPEEALDARAAVTLVLRPPVVSMAATAPAADRTTAPAADGAEPEPASDIAAELLFVQRAVVERDPWSGHMALPGGRRDPTDADLVATALRELQEETALELEPSDVIGRLDEIAPGNPSLPAIGITPFVAWFERGTSLVYSREVRDHVWVPLPVLLDEGYRSVLHLPHRGQTREFPTVEFRGYTIWGLTHRIVMSFLALLAASKAS